MDRRSLTKFWNDAWTEGLWAASWKKSVDRLTAEQAAWKPAEARHSIWQMVSHMIFWRENELERIKTGKEPTKEQIERFNFPEPAPTTKAAWEGTLRKFEETQQRIAAALADEKVNIDRLAFLLPHDCYHMGQINYVRAMLGLKPVE